MKKSFFRRFVVRWYTILGVIVLLIVGLSIWKKTHAPINLEYTTAAVGNVVEKVSVTGKISPLDKADLAFEKSGVVTKVNFAVGQAVKKGDVIAALDDAADVANLASAKAKLADLSRNLRPEELSLEKSRVDSAVTADTNARQDALNAVRNAYTQTLSAITNYTDLFFSNPQSANPTINIPTQAYSLQVAINNERVKVTDILNSWKLDLSTATSTGTVEQLIIRAQNYQNTVKLFMSDLSSIVTYLSPGNSGLSQTAINNYVAAMNSALTTLNQAIASLTDAQTAVHNTAAALSEARNNYNLKLVGSSADTIRAQSAAVAALQAALDNDRIISPIDGIVTKAEPKVGEFVSAGSNTFSVISDGGYKIEAYVPEADIAKISIQDLASTTLDAYGQYVDFPATVTAIDPAETVIEGVPTYKVTLLFVTPDTRIRSGMTANLEILTNERDGVLTIPSRAVIDQNGTKTVRLLRADGRTFTNIPVSVGLKGSLGTIEITSGIVAGDKIVTYVK